jgi:predicted nucleic acid-binding protein
MAGGFVDTNVLVYAFTTDPKSAAALDVLEQRATTSVQTLNEFANVARRKLGMTWPEVRDALAQISILCRTILPLDIETHVDGLRIAERYGYAIFDALLVASALRAGSDILWSEDMQDGAVIDGRLRLVNPFREI